LIVVVMGRRRRGLLLVIVFVGLIAICELLVKEGRERGTRVLMWK
jgi:hypothetical protein